MLDATLAILVGANPFSLDGPHAETLMVGVVAREMAMLDQSPTGVSAVEVDDFVLLPGVSTRRGEQDMRRVTHLTHFRSRPVHSETIVGDLRLW